MALIIDILNQWQSWGVYDVILPFLLIFAITYGILAQIKTFGDNRAVSVVSAVVIGMFAISVDYVSVFFREIFPRVAIGLSVILALLILAGMFIVDDEKRYWAWAFGAIAFIAWLISVAGSFDGWGFDWGGNVESYAGAIVGIVVMIGLIIAIAASGNPKRGTDKLDGSKGPGIFFKTE